MVYHKSASRMNTGDDVMTFAEQLRSLREKAGLTQTQLAEKTGLPLGSVRNYEQGQREPYWDVIFRLAPALGVTCAAFAGCVDAVPDPVEKQTGRPRKTSAAAEKPAPAPVAPHSAEMANVTAGKAKVAKGKRGKGK
jgi:transcriptional regulator with XRE-family HTH domain